MIIDHDLLDSIDNALPTLEDIREGIIQVEANKSNRVYLDRAYRAVADAILNLEQLRNLDGQPKQPPAIGDDGTVYDDPRDMPACSDRPNAWYR